MRKTVRNVLLTMWVVSAALWGADSLVGAWKLNIAKSKYTPGPGPKSSTVTYETAGNGVKVTTKGVNAEGKPTGVQYTVTYDGKEAPLTGSETVDSISMRRIDANTVETTAKKAGKVIGKGKRVVSADGKTLTITSSGTNAKGEKTSSVAVYEK